METRTGLDTLPAEIQHDIIRNVDPTTLISLGQTSSHFRQTIRPSKKHFAERLLAIESIPEYGGTALVYVSRTGTLTPETSHPSWQHMRWACTDCLRLLPHHHFDNHSILGLAYRKPPPEWPAADMVTSWEPSASRKHRGNHHQAVVSRNGIPSPHRRLYHTAITCPFDPPEGLSLPLHMEAMEELHDMTYAEFQQLNSYQKLKTLDRFALLYEQKYCGYGRRLRKCNECQYRRGQLKPEAFRLGGVKKAGTARVPIVLSRMLLFGCPLDRYFPGFSEALGVKRPSFDPIVFRNYSERTCGEYWKMYMVRCPQCSQWQEIREFRIGGIYSNWRPTTHDRHFTWDDQRISDSLLDDLCCNKCFVKAHGEQEFVETLHRWVKTVIGHDLMGQTHMLLFGFDRLQGLWICRPSPRDKHHTEMADASERIMTFRKKGSDLSEDDIALLSSYYEKSAQAMAAFTEGQRTSILLLDHNFQAWLENFGDIKQFWEWLKACKDNVGGKGEVVAKWVLNRDGAAFN